MLDKAVDNPEDSVKDIEDGAILMVGGYGLSGHPTQLLAAVLRKGVRNLTLISNAAGVRDIGLGGLILHGRVRRLICTFATGGGMEAIKAQVEQRRMEVEIVPQGTLVERIRAAGAGLGGILTPTGLDTEVTHGRRILEIDQTRCVLEPPLEADFALIHAHRGDRWGNLHYRLGARNFNPVMAMAGQTTIAEIEHLVELGEIPPEHVHTPGIFVDRIVLLESSGSQAGRARAEPGG